MSSRLTTSAISNKKKEELRNIDLLIYSRKLCVFAAVLLPIFGILHRKINPNVIDPVQERLFLSAYSFSLLLMSFTIDWVKRNFMYFAYSLLYVVSIWTVHILILNNFLVDYAFGLLIVIFGSVGFKKPTHLALYFIIMICLIALACLLVTEPQMNRGVLIGSLAAAGLVAYIVFSSRIRLQEELAASEELLKSIFNESADALFLVSNETGTIIDCNDRARRLFEADRKDRLIGIPVTALQKNGSKDAESPAAPQKVSSDQHLGKELEYVTKQGREFWGDLAISEIRIGENDLMLVRISDITERKRAEEALRHSEERYRSLVENTLDGYFIFEVPTGKCLFLNQRICELFGYTTREALSLSVWDVIAPQEHGRIREQLRVSGKGRNVSPEPRTYRAIRKDGSTFRAEVSTSLVFFQGVTAIQGTLKDVTEREQLQRQLQHAQKMQAVGTLAGGVAHEFNNILASIQGYVQLMGWKMDEDHPMAEYIRNIEASCQRAAALTRKMLTFSRLDAGEKLPVKINQVVEGVHQFLKPTLPPRIEVKLDLRKGLPMVMAEPAQIEQVLVNLGVNAIDAMAGGGEIWFRSRLIDLDAAFCRTHPWAKEGRYVELIVEDTGEGIPQEILEHLFEPFFTTKEPGEGTGLGLAIAYSIVKNHNGYILAESEEGRGSRFRVFLPAASKEIKPALSGSMWKEELPQGKGESILVVDDELQLRQIARDMLCANGYRVTQAAHGDEAIRLYREALNGGEAFDLVILDLAMPFMDGETCLEYLMEMDPGARVLFVTGYGGEALKTNLHHRGAQDVLFKPFDLSVMLKKVSQILEDGPPVPAPPLRHSQPHGSL